MSLIDLETLCDSVSYIGINHHLQLSTRCLEIYDFNVTYSNKLYIRLTNACSRVNMTYYFRVLSVIILIHNRQVIGVNQYLKSISI